MGLINLIESVDFCCCESLWWHFLGYIIYRDTLLILENVYISFEDDVSDDIFGFDWFKMSENIDELNDMI